MMLLLYNLNVLKGIYVTEQPLNLYSLDLIQLHLTA